MDDEGPDLNEHFMTDDFENTVDTIKTLAEESSMRKLNAQKASKAFKMYI